MAPPAANPPQAFVARNPGRRGRERDRLPHGEAISRKPRDIPECAGPARWPGKPHEPVARARDATCGGTGGSGTTADHITRSAIHIACDTPRSPSIVTVRRCSPAAIRDRSRDVRNVVWGVAPQSR